MQITSKFNIEGATVNVRRDFQSNLDVISMQVDNVAYASFLRVITDSGFVHTPLSLVSINANIARGALSSRFIATLIKEDLGARKIMGFALSGNMTSQQIGLVNIDSFLLDEYSCTITVNIVVNLQASNATRFVATDDNIFARWLLGVEGLSVGSDFAMHRGVSLVDARSSVGDSTFAGASSVEILPRVTGVGLQIEADIDAGINEVTVFVRDKPCLRIALHALLEHQFSFNGIVNLEHVLNLNALTLAEVQTLSQAGNSVRILDTEIIASPRRFIKNVGARLLNFDPQTRVIADPSNTSAAFISGDMLYLVNENGGRLVVVAMLNLAGGQAFLPFSNEVVVLYSHHADVYKFSAGDGLKRESTVNFATTTSGEAVVAKRGEDYLIIRKINNGAHWERGFFVGANYTPVQTRVSVGGELFFRNRYHIGLVTYNKGAEFWQNVRAYCWGRVLDTTVTNNLNSFLNAHSVRNVASILDGLVHVHISSSDTDFSALYMPFSNLAHMVTTDSTIQLRGDYGIMTNSTGTRQMIHFFRQTQSIGFFSLNDMQDITEAIRVGSFLIVRRDSGDIDDYAIDPMGFAIYNPFFNTMHLASGNARGRITIDSNRRRLVLTIGSNT